jgi:hypothetical protein
METLYKHDHKTKFKKSTDKESISESIKTLSDLKGLIKLINSPNKDDKEIAYKIIEDTSLHFYDWETESYLTPYTILIMQLISNNNPGAYQSFVSRLKISSWDNRAGYEYDQLYEWIKSQDNKDLLLIEFFNYVVQKNLIGDINNMFPFLNVKSNINWG